MVVKPPLGPALYGVALALIITPIVDIFATTWPPEFGLAEWRYGMVGNSANYLLTPILGLTIAGFGAYWLGHRTTCKVIGVICGIAAIAILAGLFSFTLDVVEVRQSVVDEALPLFTAGAMKAGFKLATTGLLLVVMAIGFWRAGSVTAAVELGPEGVEWRGGTAEGS